MFRAYLMAWIVSYTCFLLYPTEAPRPQKVEGEGFFVWILTGAVYGTDPPYNCFPSLHVAHAFISAFACHRVHRGVGLGLLIWAALLGVSTVYTKQHYVADVIAGVIVAIVAYAAFIRSCPRYDRSALDHLVAPIFAVSFVLIPVMIIAGVWLAYLLRG